MPTTAFDVFRTELRTLKELLKGIHIRTLRDELLLERFRTLFRTWVATIQGELQSQIQDKKEFLKLSAELESLAKLTSKFKPISEYRKRLTRALSLANSLVLLLPPSYMAQNPPLTTSRDKLFISGIPDLPVRLVPNQLIGWKREIEGFTNEHPFDKSIFIMIRYRKKNAGLIEMIKNILSKNGVEAILASENQIMDDLYNPIACLLCCSKGIVVFDSPEARQTFNPNVAYELGMMHLLGRECLILKHKKLTKLHTDILMKLYREYNTASDAELVLNQWITVKD